MAPLTWRNVDAPSFSGSNDMWRTAAQLMNQGFDRAQQGLKDFRDITTDEQSAQLMQQVAAAGNDPAKIAAITAGANPAYLSPAALNFANNQPGVLLDREGKQLQNTGEGIQNTIRGQSVRANDYNFDRTQIDNQRADQKYAQMPEAITAMTTLRSDIANGKLSPEEAASRQAELVKTYGQTLNITDASQVGAFMSGNLKALGDQQDANVKSLKYAAGLDETIKAQDAKGIATNVLGMVGNDPDQAIRAIKQFGNVDPEVKVAALAQVEALRVAMPTKTAADSALESGTLFPDAKSPQITLPQNYQPVIMQNQGKRNLPLNSNLNAALNSVLPNLGVTAIVTSGGQVTKDEADAGLGERTGSVRHDHGGAADVKFRAADGHILSWERNADVPQLEQVVKSLKEAGLTGFGAGEGYMGPDTTHIGYGTPAVWGAKNGKPYQALLDAYNGATTKVTNQSGPTVDKAAAQNAQPQYQAAMDAISQNQPYNAPIDSSKVQIQNTDGTVSTEKTFTTQIGDAWFNIPSIVNGKQLPEAEALKQFQQGTNPAVGVFQNKREAEDAAQARSDNIGKMLDNAAASKDQAVTAQTQAQNDQITNAVTPAVPEVKTAEPVKKEDLTQDVQVAGNITIPGIKKSDTGFDRFTNDRETEVNRALGFVKQQMGGTMGDNALGSTWDYFTADQDTAAANAATRDATTKARDFYDTPEAKKYFSDNPSQFKAALADPVAFANNFGKTPSQQQAQADVKANTQAAADKPTEKTPEEVASSRTRDLNAAETVEQAFSSVKATQSIDAANDQYPGLREAIQKAPENKETEAQVASRLTGKDGTLSAYKHQEVTQAIQQISKELKIKPSVAAALLEIKGNYSDGYLGGYAFGLGKGYQLDGSVMQDMKDLYRTYQQGADAKPGVGNMVSADLSAYQTKQVTALEKEVNDTTTALKAALADKTLDPAKAMDYQRRLSQMPNIVKARLNTILAAGNTDQNIRSNTNK